MTIFVNSLFRLKIQTLLITVGWVLALWLSAKVVVPIWPVPFTFQVMVLFIMALIYRSEIKQAVAPVLLYLAIGALGVPVFAGSAKEPPSASADGAVEGISASEAGLAYMAGPTGGYLLGFVLAVWAMAFLAKRWEDSLEIPVMFVIMLMGMLIIQGLGLLWLSQVLPDTNLWAVFWPYALGDMVKIGLAIFALRITGIVKRPML